MIFSWLKFPFILKSVSFGSFVQSIVVTPIAYPQAVLEDFRTEYQSCKRIEQIFINFFDIITLIILIIRDKNDRLSRQGKEKIDILIFR